MNFLQFFAAGLWPMVAAGFLLAAYSFTGKALAALEVRAAYREALAKTARDFSAALDLRDATINSLSQRVEIFEGKLKTEGSMAAINKTFAARRGA